MFSLRGLRLYFPVLEPWVVWSASLPLPVPPSLSVLECGAMGSASRSLACPVPQSATLLGTPAAALPRVLSTPAARLCPSTSLDECFFFFSLVVRLPYSSIFCQFWLFFVFKMLLSFFWLCEEVQCVYLHLHLGWNSLQTLLI